MRTPILLPTKTFIKKICSKSNNAKSIILTLFDNFWYSSIFHIFRRSIHRHFLIFYVCWCFFYIYSTIFPHFSTQYSSKFFDILCLLMFFSIFDNFSTFFDKVCSSFSTSFLTLIFNIFRSLPKLAQSVFNDVVFGGKSRKKI